jgi:UDP-N-acetylglucosamine 2-epimerase
MYKEYKKKYCLVFSTRPEIIKLYPIIKELKKIHGKKVLFMKAHMD